MLRQPVGAPPAVTPAGGGGGGIGNLFRRVTGASSGLMRRSLPEAPAPVAAPRADAPAPHAAPAAPRPASAPLRPPQQEEIGLDIPTFLRRQSN